MNRELNTDSKDEASQVYSSDFTVVDGLGRPGILHLVTGVQVSGEFARRKIFFGLQARTILSSNLHWAAGDAVT